MNLVDLARKTSTLLRNLKPGMKVRIAGYTVDKGMFCLPRDGGLAELFQKGSIHRIISVKECSFQGLNNLGRPCDTRDAMRSYYGHYPECPMGGMMLKVHFWVKDFRGEHDLCGCRLETLDGEDIR